MDLALTYKGWYVIKPKQPPRSVQLCTHSKRGIICIHTLLNGIITSWNVNSLVGIWSQFVMSISYGGNNYTINALCSCNNTWLMLQPKPGISQKSLVLSANISFPCNTLEVTVRLGYSVHLYIYIYIYIHRILWSPFFHLMTRVQGYRPLRKQRMRSEWKIRREK